MQQSDNDNVGTRELAVAVISKSTDSEKVALLQWAREVQSILKVTDSSVTQLQLVIKATVKFDVLLPLMKHIVSEIKRLGWDERGLPARLGLAAAGAALTMSGSGARIAALGGAVGVPLWLVFGAGGTFVGVVIDEISKTKE